MCGTHQIKLLNANLHVHHYTDLKYTCYHWKYAGYMYNKQTFSKQKKAGNYKYNYIYKNFTKEALKFKIEHFLRGICLDVYVKISVHFVCSERLAQVNK